MIKAKKVYPEWLNIFEEGMKDSSANLPEQEDKPKEYYNGYKYMEEVKKIHKETK